jgi:hypothetical protein
MTAIDLDYVKNLSERMIIETFSEANYDLWFSGFCRDSVFICNGEPMLIGDGAIRSHFEKMPKIRSNVAMVNCTARKIGENGAQTYGTYILGTKDSNIFTTVYFSLTFQIYDNKPKILLQHLFYDYHVQKANDGNAALTIDLNTVDFVRTLLLNIGGSRIEIRSGSQTVFLDPATVLYVDSRKNKTEFVCVDRNITCNQSISDVQKLLPDYFYPLRRGNLVNLNYVIAIRRFELEMISDIIIPIPEKNYTAIKADIGGKLANAGSFPYLS